MADELTTHHRLKFDKKTLPTVAIIDSQSVKNSTTAPQQVGFDRSKLIKGRKRFLIVDTMGHLLWADVCPVNVTDGKDGVLLWKQAEHLNFLLDDLVLLDVDSTFREQLETM